MASKKKGIVVTSKGMEKVVKKAKKAVASKEVSVSVEEKFGVVIRIPTVMYGYMEIAAIGTPEELMRVHARFCNAYAALAKTAVRASLEVAPTRAEEVGNAIAAEIMSDPKPEALEKAVPDKGEASSSRLDEMFKKKGEPVQQDKVVMRSKSWILAEERLRSIMDPNALEVLAGQVKKSEKMPEAEKPQFLALIKEREQELTDDLLDN